MLVEKFPDREIKIGDKTFMYFGGTAYLGLPTIPEFQKAIFQGIGKWGTFYGSSRSSNIQLSIYNEAEKFFANQIGTEASLTISSGTLAGKLAIQYLEKQAQQFYHHPKTHPAILSSLSKPVFVDNSLHPDLLSPENENIVITSDTILSGEVNTTSFDFLKEIHSNKKITMVIDMSHTLGILNSIHHESLTRLNNINRIIKVASLGKALGISGGIVGADFNFIETIKKEHLFVSSSCPNAAYLFAYLKSQDLIENQKKKLYKNIEFVSSHLNHHSLKFQPPYPVIYSDDPKLYNYLLENEIIISNFTYPNYNGLMNRIVITANHTFSDLSKLLEKLSSF